MAGRKFDLCVIFAEMRTGSNHLEAILNGVPGLRGFGELFNPVFIGRQDQDRAFGFDLDRREADPLGLLQAIIEEAGDDLPIFRFFHDHDARVLDPLLDDPRVAKVILRRNPLDSYISHKIAMETGQWKMGDVRQRRAAEVAFDAAEFGTMLEAWGGFSDALHRGLQIRGQTAFEIGYDSLPDTDVLDGLVRYLGRKAEVDLSASTLKPQNPGGPGDKVSNPDDMAQALAQLDPFGLERSGVADLPRPMAVRRLVVMDDPGVMFMPVPGVQTTRLQGWCHSLGSGDPKSGLTQKALRQWMRAHPGHSRISVLNHPLTRAHDVFCADVLPRRPKTRDMRRKLRQRYGVPLPQNWPDEDYDLAAHLTAFSAFLAFLGPCLAGQTSLAPRPGWAGQMAALQGMAGFAVPDHVLRAETLEAELAALGLPPAPMPEPAPFALTDIVSDELEQLAYQVYRRDYVFFGYSQRWPGLDQAA